MFQVCTGISTRQGLATHEHDLGTLAQGQIRDGLHGLEKLGHPHVRRSVRSRLGGIVRTSTSPCETSTLK